MSRTRTGTYFRVNTSKHSLKPLHPKAILKLTQGTQLVIFGQGETGAPDTLISVDWKADSKEPAIINLGHMHRVNEKVWPIIQHRLQWQPDKRRWDWIPMPGAEKPHNGPHFDGCGHYDGPVEDQSVYIALMPKTITDHDMKLWNGGYGDPFHREGEQD